MRIVVSFLLRAFTALCNKDSGLKRWMGMQVIVLQRSRIADVKMIIYNSDGSEAGACGNASRCVTRLCFDLGHTAPALRIETRFLSPTPTLRDFCQDRAQDWVLDRAGIIEGQRWKTNQATVNMGEPRLHWKEIPLSW
jgi:diaminopimelate epimerase